MGPHLDQVAPLLLQICTLATQDVSMEGGRDDEHEVLPPGRFQGVSVVFRVLGRVKGVTRTGISHRRSTLVPDKGEASWAAPPPGRTRTPSKKMCALPLFWLLRGSVPHITMPCETLR